MEPLSITSRFETNANIPYCRFSYKDERLLSNPCQEIAMGFKEACEDTVPQSKNVKKEPWTPYPEQRLVESRTGRIIATYTRNAPLSKQSGTLTIYPKLLTVKPETYMDLTAELVEGVVAVTAAMVDMQRRNGTMWELWEASKESLRWLESAPHPLHSDG